MGDLVRRIGPLVTQTMTSTRTRDARRWIAERRRRLTGAPHRIEYFHQVDDPYSQLAAQVLAAIVARYDVELVPFLVGPPPDSAAPERARLEAFARRDAADVAPGYRLAFPANAQAPDTALCGRAAAILAQRLASPAFADAAARVGNALWSGNAAGIDTLARELGEAGASQTAAHVAAGSRRREKLGHYLGAMFLYGGEWYWGVDRLQHLERRLQALGALRPGVARGLIAPRPAPSPVSGPKPGQRITLEFYPSLRSPYTHIAMERVYALARSRAVDLVLRPVLPMVMRGLPVPRAKQFYIALDTKREADDAGVPFGRISDPVGRPVERAFSLFPWARERGRAAELLLAFTRAAFAEGVDTGTDTGMCHVVESAGLSWQEARAHIDREGWRDELEVNRQALFALGLWGVPSFCLRAADGTALYSTWGQDRIWRVEQEIQRWVGVVR